MFVSLAGGTWTTGDYRARITSVAITDGRCFHCDAPLLDLDDDGPPSPPARPLNVDHAVPRVAGGPDRVDNYLGSCESCNKRRQETPLSAAAARRAAELWADLDVDAVNVSARQLDDYLGRAVLTCRACALHSWHVEGSPAHVSCVDAVLRTVSSELRRLLPEGGRAWAGVFGADAAEALTRTMGSALWTSPKERPAVLIQRPRVLCRNLARIDEILLTARGYRDLRDDPHERHPDTFSGLLRLAPTTAERRAAARLSADAGEAARAYTEFAKVRWRAVFKLFLRRRWPTHLLYDHRARIGALTTAQRRRMLADLRALGSVAEVFAYFEPAAPGTSADSSSEG